MDNEDEDFFHVSSDLSLEIAFMKWTLVKMLYEFMFNYSDLQNPCLLL